jgi:hypothetical protein
VTATMQVETSSRPLRSLLQHIQLQSPPYPKANTALPNITTPMTPPEQVVAEFNRLVEAGRGLDTIRAMGDLVWRGKLPEVADQLRINLIR